MRPMAELNVDQSEVGILAMGLSCIEDAWLTEDGKAARARLAYKLGAAFAELYLARKQQGGESDG